MTINTGLEVIRKVGDWMLVENQELGQVFFNAATGELSLDPPPEVHQKISALRSSKRHLSVSNSGLEPVQEVCEELLTPVISPLARQQMQTLLSPESVPMREMHSARKRSSGDDLNSIQVPEKIATTQMLIRASNADLRKGETQQRRLGRATHLKLNGLQITRLDDLAQHCPRLRVLYAFDNNIRSMEPLRERLETCYLQTNELHEMASWSQTLPHLRVLNVSRNAIARLEGLHQCQALEELNISYQKLTNVPNPQLSFSPQTLAGLRNLRSLNIAGNGLEDLAGFGVLTALTRLDAGENYLNDVADLMPVLYSCLGLAWLRLEGNPLCRDARYRDAVIGDAEGPLVEVDGRVVTDQQRNLCKRIEKRRVQNGIHSARGSGVRTQLISTPDLGLSSTQLNSARGSVGATAIPKSARSSLAMAGGMAVMTS